MASRIERRTRAWSLTRRLVVALSIGAFFVALVLGFLGADRDAQQQASSAADADRVLAAAMAERAGPLLDRGDVMRLSMLAAVVRDQVDGRAMVLDRAGKVVIDSALVMGERQMSLLSGTAPFQRIQTLADGSRQRESLAPVRFGGEVIGEVRVQRAEAAQAAVFDFSWFGLVLLSCLTLVAAAAMLGHHWSARVREASDALVRLAAGELPGESRADADSELQDFGVAMRELERGMQEGMQNVTEGYVAMAQQVVDNLEQRRLVPPGHGERTARLAARLAERLQLLADDRAELQVACRLVELGKASVRASILQKQGPLTEVESRSLEHHPVRAAERLECVPGLRRVAKILRHQLERYDGRGTPDALRGDRIPLGSRVLAIAASFDYLTTCAADKPLEWPEALRQLQAAKGEVFDPWLVDLFTEVVEKDPPQPFDREVMIVPGGVMPWRDVAHDAEHDDVEDADAELEVMLDDFPFEEKS
ncbi:MAG: hypothetical protein H6835_04365 [Planctomycetes bacterium]|nr:hypothetical protein [Planctomycetota bacterium]